MFQLAVLVFGACALSGQNGDVPREASYGVYISQLVRFSRACNDGNDFNERNLCITEKLFKPVYAQTLSPSNIIRCRVCQNASNIHECNIIKECDSTLEACYIDECITDQLTIVYEGGCRSKDVCFRGLVGKRNRRQCLRKKRDFDCCPCSRCCDIADDCNRRLCAVGSHVNVNTSQCYSCDQGGVKDPKNCVTLEACQQNEVCYAQQSDSGGVNRFFYGCRSKLQCVFLMKQAYETYRICKMNDKSVLPPGMTREEVCISNDSAANLCHSCCADGGCNYGNCEEINERIFRLADNGRFDFDTLKVMY